MKKKVLALILCAMMAATAVVGGTLAYFTDTDDAQNVMTLGGVNIVQNEKQRDETTGALEEFEDDKPLLPMVDTREENDPVVDDEGYFNEKMHNVVDKIISVKNEATADEVNAENKAAYVRTLIAFEGRCDIQGEYIGKLWNKTANNTPIWDINWVAKKGTEEGSYQETTVKDGERELVNAREVMIDDVVHTVIECVYVGTEFGEAGVLPAGKETAPSLKQIFMAPTAGNEINDLFGATYTIYAVTQATQIEGFADAKTALDTAWGEVRAVDDQTIFDWFKDAIPVAGN